MRQQDESADALMECPACGQRQTVAFLDRGPTPVHANLLLRSAEQARNLTRGSLRLSVCNACDFVFNPAFDLSLLSYGSSYDNTQTWSPAFANYVGELVNYLVHERGVRHRAIVEVGCGKGGFLRRLVEPAEWGNAGHGFDPAYEGPRVDLNGRLQFSPCYYGADCSHVRADVVVCRHVIEHVPKPRLLLNSIREALAGNSSAKVYFETPCVEWILKNHVMWDFCYEHCSLFTAQSLTSLFQRSGFQVEDVRHVFGGQYLWLEATLATSPCREPDASSPLLPLAQDYARQDAEYRTAWLNKVKRWREGGAVAVWGAGAKGVSFANLVDPDRQYLACVVDINPAKQSCFIPGTGHPVIGPERLKELGIATILVLNPRYTSEIESSLRHSGHASKVVDLMEDAAISTP